MFLETLNPQAPVNPYTMPYIGPKEYRCSASITWDGATGGKAKARTFEVEFDTPKEFQGLDRSFCPDELLLSAIGGCLINTFLSFKRRFKLEVKSIEAHVKCEVKIGEGGGYRINSIEADLRAYTTKEEYLRVLRYLELARESCHITRSIDRCIPIEVRLEVEAH